MPSERNHGTLDIAFLVFVVIVLLSTAVAVGQLLAPPEARVALMLPARAGSAEREIIVEEKTPLRLSLLSRDGATVCRFEGETFPPQQAGPILLRRAAGDASVPVRLDPGPETTIEEILRLAESLRASGFSQIMLDPGGATPAVPEAPAHEDTINE